MSETLSDDELRRLDEALKNDDHALSVFLNCCQLEADLFFHGRATLAGRRVLSDIELKEPTLGQPQPASSIAIGRRTWRFRYPNADWFSALAAALLLGIGIFFGVLGTRLFFANQSFPSGVADLDAG